METFELIKQNGRFDLRPLINWLCGQNNGSFRIEISRVRGKRTDQQNRWLWGCIYPLVLQGLLAVGDDRFTNVDDVHDYLKHKFNSVEVVDYFTGEVLKIPNSTRKMDKVEFSAYCEKIRDFAREYLDMEIPDPQ